MPEVPKTILCPCGYVLTGEDDDAVVGAARVHARDIHQQRLSREQALAMVRPSG